MARDFISNVVWLWEHEALGVGTHSKTVSLDGTTDIAFQWAMHQAAAGANAATIEYYPSLWPVDHPETTNFPEWFSQDLNAVHTTYPGTSVTSDMITLADSPWKSMRIDVVVTTALPEFSMVLRGKQRG